MRPLPVDLVALVLNDLPDLLGKRYLSEPFDVTDKNLVDIQALLERPFQVFDGKELYPTVAEKAAVLFYQTIKGHKLLNGNKRTAVILLLTFLSYNNYWLSITEDEMYSLSLGVAQSKDSEQVLIMKRLIERFALVIRKIND